MLPTQTVIEKSESDHFCAGKCVTAPVRDCPASRNAAFSLAARGPRSKFASLASVGVAAKEMCHRYPAATEPSHPLPYPSSARVTAMRRLRVRGTHGSAEALYP
jgi:hypothetical protein